MPEPNYPVGKNKPPKHSRFKKGQSGNPGGKPRIRPTTSMQQRLRDAMEDAFLSPWHDVYYERDDWLAVDEPMRRLARELVVEGIKGGNRAARTMLLSLMEKLDKLKMNESVNEAESLSLSEGKAEGSSANSPATAANAQANQELANEEAPGSGNASGKQEPGMPAHQKPIVRIGGRLVENGY